MFLFFFHLMLFDSFGKLLVEEGALVLLEREPHYFVLVNLLRERLFFSLLLKFLHQPVHQLLSRRHVGRPLRTADKNAIITEHIVELVIVVAGCHILRLRRLLRICIQLYEIALV